MVNVRLIFTCLFAFKNTSKPATFQIYFIEKFSQIALLISQPYLIVEFYYCDSKLVLEILVPNHDVAKHLLRVADYADLGAETWMKHDRTIGKEAAMFLHVDEETEFIPILREAYIDSYRHYKNSLL